MPWTDEAIETRRLRLRPFTDQDKPAIAELSSSPEVRRYLGGPLDAVTISGVADAVVGEREGIFCIAHRDTDQAVGSVSLDRQRGELEVSYELIPTAWRQGFATEAVEALLGWVWSHESDSTLIAVTQAANVASRRLLERLGFTLDNEFDEYDAPQCQYRIRRPTHTARTLVDHD